MTKIVVIGSGVGTATSCSALNVKYTALVIDSEPVTRTQSSYPAFRFTDEMIVSQQFDSEDDRLRRLYQLGILDTPQDQLFSALVEQALTIVPSASIAAISLVDRDRQWFKSIKGLNSKEMPRSVSFCSHTIQTSGIMVVEDAAEDDRFASNPLVTGAPKIRSYTGVKLMNGVGALCVIGLHRNRPSAAELAGLAKLARFVDIQLLAHGTHYNLERPAAP